MGVEMTLLPTLKTILILVILCIKTLRFIIFSWSIAILLPLLMIQNDEFLLMHHCKWVLIIHLLE